MPLTKEQFNELFNQGLSPEQIVSFESGEKPEFDFSVGETIKNIPGSAGRIAQDIFNVVRHPVQTVKGIGKLGAGAVEKLIPGEQPQEKQFENVVEFFKERYGGIENIQKTVQEDPVGFAGDIASLLTGGGAALKGVGTVSKLGKVTQAGQAIQKVGLATEPLTAVTKGAFITTYPIRKIVGPLTREALGVTTGAGGDVIKEAFLNPTAEFKQALRGQVKVDNILTTAKESLDTLKEQRATAYRSSLVSIKEAKESIDILPFKNSIDNKLKEFNIKVAKDGTLDFSKSAIADPAEAKRIGEFVEEIRKWDDATPSGLDILKQRLDDFYTPSGRGRALTTSISSNLKNILSEKIQGYKKMTAEYAEASNTIKEIEKTLSLTPGTSVDTTLKKLMSTLRQNNEFRKELMTKLDNLTKKNLTAQIAGTALSPVIPSGLIGRQMFATVFGAAGAAVSLGAVSPLVFLGLAFTSPRVIGEFLRVLGLSAKAASSAASFITSPIGKEILLGGFQVGRTKNIKSQ